MLPVGLEFPQSRTALSYAKLLLVEGADAFYFFKPLLHAEKLLDQIEIRNFGSVTDLHHYLSLLKRIDGFDRVNSLGIVRDAEDNAHSAFLNVCRSLEHAGLAAPTAPAVTANGLPNVTVFILPDCKNPGMLETLCLSAVKSDRVMPCIEKFFRCVQRQGMPMPNNQYKAQAHAFLATRPVPDLQLGEAAASGFWCFGDPAFDQLKQFLRAL